MRPIFLEEWIRHRIKRKVEEDREYRRFVGKECLKAVTRQDLEDFQLFKLQKTLSYVTEKSPFYKDMFAKNGIKPDQFNSLDDLNKIPFTYPEDLSRQPFRLQCVPMGKVARVFTFNTSGTTGIEKRVFFTERDLDYVIDFFTACAKTVSGDDGVIQVLLPDGRPFSQADLLGRGVRKAGRVAVVTGADLDFREQIRKMEESNSNVLVGTVSCIYRVTQESREYHRLGKMGIETIVTTSEYLPEPTRKELQDVWECEVYAHYGLTEMGLGVALECENKGGFHVNEADFVVEVINPETGEALTGEGEEGELVFTTLSRQGMPLLRYRTRDLSRLMGQPCECGASIIRRVGEIKGRLEG